VLGVSPPRERKHESRAENRKTSRSFPYRNEHSKLAGLHILLERGPHWPQTGEPQGVVTGPACCQGPKSVDDHTCPWAIGFSQRVRTVTMEKLR
jgi:hypothetical protein